MFCKRAQIATEYLIITGVILVIVSVIFAYSYSTNDQSIRISMAGSALEKMVNKADLVYAFGPDNNQFVDVQLPRGLVQDSVRDITICSDGYNVHDGLLDNKCVSEGHGGVSAGAIELQIGLIGGISTVSRPSKAELELDFEAPYAGFPSGEGFYRVKVFWCGDKVCLKRV